jgi:hypothetical protein
VTARLRHGLSVVLWVVAVILIALGGAGIVAATDPGTGTADRSRLTYTADVKVTPAIEAAEADLAKLADQVDALGVQARGALSATIGGDASTVDAALAAGDAILASIETGSKALTADLAAIPYISTPEAPLHVSPALRARHAHLVEAVKATDGLHGAWDTLTISSAAATHLASQLAQHDELVGKAAQQGREAKYKAAVKTLKSAATVIADSKTSRDALAKTVDVTVLDQWLDRNEAYDKALAGLYEALESVGGKVTNKVRKAIAAEKAARAQLPPDSRGLVVIMGDIAQGGMNGAIVTIEEAKADLSDVLDPDTSPSPAP